MPSEAVESIQAMKIADPMPTHCSCCYAGAQEGMVFVDMQAEFDGPTWQMENGATLQTVDDLMICKACIREAAELLAMKPAMHQNQLRAIRRLELRAEHWEHYAKELERTIGKRPRNADD